ncbi:sialidase isoform X1 [Pyrus x bretschneideri]|uniref:sialidase isoform X1 n=1 Tax=Pyrus x bretschneideri TaxID=225117 RepID=UPI00202E4C83|nr:sialidase isoform X1 [Pyrus x bretschneideri]
MAGYDHNYRSGYSNGPGGGPHTNKWNKTSYADDECRTIIVGADGTRRTIIGCAPFQQQGSYVMKTETIISERILSPAKEYGYADDWSRPSSPAKGYGYAADDHKLHRPSSPAKGYGYAVADPKVHRPSSPPKNYGYAIGDQYPRRPPSPPKNYGYTVGDQYPRRRSSPPKSYAVGRPSSPPKSYAVGRPSSPPKSYAVGRRSSPPKSYAVGRPSSPPKSYAVGDRYPRPSSPVKGYGYSADHQQLRRPSSPEDDYPQEVGDFLTKVQTEASRDQRANRHQPAPKAAHNDTYGDYSNYNNKTSYKPNGNTIRNDNHDDYPPKYYSDMGPNTVTNGGHQPRPSRPAWTPQPSGPAWTPPSREGRLSSATDDIETALRFLKEGAMSSSAAATTPQYSQYSTVPKHGEYPTDAAKRNATFNAPSWPRTT